MACTSGKHLVCFIHIGGQFISNGEGFLQYVGGTTRLKVIKESTSCEEFKTMIRPIVGEHSNEFIMRFTVSCDAHTFVDLMNDEGMEHLINFNEDKGHVYVEEKGDDNAQSMIDELMGEEQV